VKERIFFKSFGCREKKTKRNSKFAPPSPFFLTFHLKSLLSLSLSQSSVQLDQLVRYRCRGQHAQIREQQRDEFGRSVVPRRVVDPHRPRQQRTKVDVLALLGEALLPQGIQPRELVRLGGDVKGHGRGLGRDGDAVRAELGDRSAALDDGLCSDEREVDAEGLLWERGSFFFWRGGRGVKRERMCEREKTEFLFFCCSNFR